MRASRYRIRTPRPLPHPGSRSLPRPGRGEEFYDHRPYVAGDDLRLLDWRATARLGRPIVRRRNAEREARFWLWIDGSASMSLFGKRAYAERISQVLMQAATGERLWLHTPKGLRRPSFPLVTDPRGLLAARPRGRGTPILITDGLEEGDFAAYFRGLPPFHLILVLAPEELDPPPLEALIQDVETGERVPVNEKSVRLYREALAEHLSALRRLATRRGNLALLRVGEPVLPGLYREGVIELR